MTECLDKNMIDKDEYPQTAELESRCVNILADLWHAPEHGAATGCSTTGSSEACMLGGMALLWRWRQRRRAAGADAAQPNLVMGSNVQVCWEKFCRYWQVEPRLVPMEPDRLHLRGPQAAAQCDENTIGVVAILGSTMDGSYEPVAEISAELDRLAAHRRPRRPDPRGRRLGRIRRALPPARSGVGLPGPPGGLDQRVRAQVRAGLPGRGLGRVAGRRRAARGPGVQGRTTWAGRCRPSR